MKKVKCKFEQIDNALIQLAKDLNSQLSDEHMFYDVEFDGQKICLDDESTKEDKELFMELLITDALNISMHKAMGDVDADPWSRVKFFMALRLPKEAVQSPMTPTEYEEFKVNAEKARALDMESIAVNNQRPEWTQEQQMALLKKKEEDESIEMATKQDKK
jgi:hypothetical protein